MHLIICLCVAPKRQGNGQQEKTPEPIQGSACHFSDASGEVHWCNADLHAVAHQKIEEGSLNELELPRSPVRSVWCIEDKVTSRKEPNTKGEFKL